MLRRGAGRPCRRRREVGDREAQSICAAIQTGMYTVTVRPQSGKRGP